jgi:catechol 2,3-dioxygenase-like lactoylglutathione lyase family enzyme
MAWNPELSGRVGRPGRPGWDHQSMRLNHVALTVSDRERSAAFYGEHFGLVERLGQAGVAETEWQEDGGFVRVQVADPDGYRVELFAY